MKENDEEKLPGLPGDEVDEGTVVSSEEQVDEGSEEITADTVFAREELEELYEMDELEAIIDLQDKQLPDGDYTKDDLINVIVGEEEAPDEAIDESMEVPETEEAVVEAEEEPVAEAEVPVVEEAEVVEAEVVEEKKEEKPKTRGKGKKKPNAKKKEEAPAKEEESPAKEEAPKNPVADAIEEKEESKTKRVPKAKVEKNLPKTEVEEKVKMPKVETVKQSALTKIEKPANDAGVLDYRPGASLDDLLTGAQKLIDGGLACGHATPEAVLGVVKYGAEIGMSAMTALNNIHMVQGKPTLGVHAISAQLKKFGVSWEIVQNYQSEDDGDVVTTIKFTDLSMLEKYKQELKYASTELEGKAADLYLAQVQDALEGKISQEFSYRWSDAAQANLTSKSNWNNHPKVMLLNRCLTLGGRSFKPEALLGLSETMEYAEVKNVEAEMEEEGHVIVLTD